MIETDRNNSKMLSQKVCKCGNAVADVIGRIDTFARSLEKVRFGESSPVLKMYEESVNVVYGGITNVETLCGIDTREEQQHSIDAFNKISEMTTTKNLTMFRHRRDEVLNNLSKIRRGIKEKVRQCSMWYQSNIRKGIIKYKAKAKQQQNAV